MSRKDTKFLQSILKEYRRSLDYFTILIIIRPGSEQNKTVMSHVWESQVEQPKAEDYLYNKVIHVCINFPLYLHGKIYFCCISYKVHLPIRP